jgi:hypothetical protein
MLGVKFVPEVTAAVICSPAFRDNPVRDHVPSACTLLVPKVVLVGLSLYAVIIVPGFSTDVPFIVVIG